MIKSIQAPRINTNDDQVGVVAWHVKDGDYVEIGQSLVDLETSKAVVTVDAEYSGYIKRLAHLNTIVRVGSDLANLADSLEELSSEINASVHVIESNKDASTQIKSSSSTFAATRISKAALNKINVSNLKIEDFNELGLITLSIVESKLNPLSTKAKSKALKINRSPVHEKSGPIVPREKSIPLGKRAEIEQLTNGEAGLLNSTLSIYFDSAIIRNRLNLLGLFDGNLSPIILYELSRLLLQWPQFTAYYHDDHVHYYDRIDLGIAVDLGKGLKVVRIKDTELLSPQEIFELTIDIGLRYLDNRIKSEELVGSTITVTDLSSYDILHFRPLINGKQSVILGIGGDSLKPGFPMSINMTFDHRVSNGREVATFLKELRTRILSYAGNDNLAITSGLGLEGTKSPDQENRSGITPPISCDTCEISMEDYERDFGRDARMVACVNSVGRLVPLCHRCYGGWL
jgi:pyruvate/2-oxoglutarate dehydrogenase complex dihydrolipoamide acyltransferase (E2) component